MKRHVAIIDARWGLLRRVSDSMSILDYGCGDGSFAYSNDYVKCFEINEELADLFKEDGRFSEDIVEFDIVCFFDVLEHLQNPKSVIDRMKTGSKAIISLPIFKTLSSIPESRHYRPGEHLYYWTLDGFIRYMSKAGFLIIDVSDGEQLAGREEIKSMAFEKIS